jgi:hypothetical protein
MRFGLGRNRGENQMSSRNFIEGTPGIFEGLAEEIYRKAPGVNISHLKSMGRSPAHYLSKITEPPEPPTEAQVFGTLLHLAVLEPERLAGKYVVRPDGLKFTTKEGKAWKEAQTVPILDEDKAKALEATAKAIRQHPTAAGILHGGKKELSVFKQDEETGLLMKGRIDCLSEDEQGFQTAIDIKTCADASPGAFAKDIAAWQYHAQAAYYSNLVTADFFLFIAVEKTPPHAIGIYSLDQAAMERGRSLYRAWLNKLVVCIEEDSWPAYSPEIETLTLPTWAMK